jgi:hypothetical protein
MAPLVAVKDLICCLWEALSSVLPVIEDRDQVVQP